MLSRKHKPTPPVTVTSSSVSPVVAVINESTVMSDDQVKAIMQALQTQCDRDFGPIWGITCTLGFASKGETIPPTTWQLVVLDDSDQAGALGYHDETPQGLPQALVFAKTDIQYGSMVSVTMSHELLEMLADAGCELSAQNSDGTFWAYEVGDPVEADASGYLIDNVTVSDFVTPWFFQTQPPANVKFDFQNHIHQPFTLASGGYANIWDGTQWTQSFNGQVTPSRIDKR